jgi:nucleoside-diphosphate-sugar epimerase
MAATGRKGKVRIRMWRDALASGVRTVEARGADYVGAGAVGIFSSILLPAISQRRTAWVPADLDAPHSFTYTGDMARTLITLAGDERAWGRAWHVPSAAQISIREMADRYCDLIGAPRVTMHKLPRWTNHLAGRFNAMMREMAEMDYQFYFPFRLDSTLTEQTFGLTATALEVGLRETAEDADRIAARTM